MGVRGAHPGLWLLRGNRLPCARSPLGAGKGIPVPSGEEAVGVSGDTRPRCGRRAAQAGAWPWDWPHALSMVTSHTRSLRWHPDRARVGWDPASPAGRAPEARAGGLQGKPHALVVRTCVWVPCVLCREHSTTSKALTRRLGSSVDKGTLLGFSHHRDHCRNTVWGLPLPTDVTVDAALHGPSLPACDKQNLKPE